MYNAVVRNSYKSNKSTKIILTKYITIIILVISIILFAISTQGRKPIEYRTIIIKKGDTLWSIVKTYQTNEVDPRKLINQIKRINNLENALLHPGQTIKVPIK